MTEKQDLTVQEALQIILDTINVLPTEEVPLLDALDRVLASPVVAHDSLPPFANSAMDGYAVRAADLTGVGPEMPATLRVIGDIAAGTVFDQKLAPGAAARIMTGAPLPPGADAVIPVEDTSEPWRDPERPLPDQIQVFRQVHPNDYIRHVGEDVQAGKVVLEAGHALRPQEVGMLASLGVARVPVFRRPRVGVLATGDELIPVDKPLKPGKIRNSNGYAQTAQVKALGAIPIPLGIARDTESDVRAHLHAGLEAGVDLFVSSAGVSVGAYDVVKAVLEQDGDVSFWRVRMRPGKPLAFGAYEDVPYLGLPGNPVSAMVSFERFVRAVILKMAGHTNLERPQIKASLQDSIQSDGRETYVRAIVTQQDGAYIATTTGSQGSHVMTSLVKANALLIVPEGITAVSPGTELTAWMLDWPGTVF